MSEITMTVEREDNEIEVTVAYTAYRACRGQHDCWGVPLEPDEPAQCEIESVRGEDGKEVELDAQEMERALEACEEDQRERAESAAEARAEARWEDGR